jgi:hypothetical protein
MLKTKVAYRKKILKDKGLSEMLGQMLGEGPVNINITFPKFMKIHEIITKLNSLFRLLSTSVLFAQKDDIEMAATIKEDIEKARIEIQQFVKSAETEVDDIYSKDVIIDINKSIVDLNLVPQEVRDKFEKKYDMMKESPIIDTYLTICNELAPFKKSLSEVNNLSDKFIYDMPGVEFIPFSFTSLNLKMIFSMLSPDEYSNNKYSDDINASFDDKNQKQIKQMEQIRRFLLLFLNKVYLITYELYKVYSEPDIDIDEFVNVISSSIKEVRKQVPRCDKAFNRILKSVKMLKNNFGVYYKDFLATKSSSIIMENFILDIAKETPADVELTMQFRKIINHYRSLAQKQGKNNDKLNFLFEQANVHLSKLDKYNNLGKSGDVQQEEDAAADDEDEIPSGPTVPITDETKKEDKNINKDKNDISSSSSSDE